MSTADLLAIWLGKFNDLVDEHKDYLTCLLYTSPSPRDS